VQVGAALGFLVIRRAGSTPGASTEPNNVAEGVARGAGVLTRVRSRRMFKTRVRWRW
jgi:hypothetical protein